MVSSAMALKLGVFRFCRPPTQKQTQNKCAHVLRVSRGFYRVIVFTLSRQYMQLTYAPDEPRLFLLREKPEDPQFEPHAGIN